MKLDYFQFAIKSLQKRKLRSFLTMIGIILAVATIFVLISTSLGLESAIQEQFQSLGTDKFFIFSKGQIAGPGTTTAAELTLEDVNVVEKVPGVKGTSYFIAGNAKVTFGNENRYVPIIGIPLESQELFVENGAFKPEQGRLLRPGDKFDVAIGSQYYHNNFYKKPVQINDILEINGLEFKVRSVLETQGNPNDDRLILMPLDQFKTIFDVGERIDEIIVQVDQEGDIKEIAERTERRLRASRDVTEKTQDFYILTPEELLGTFGTILDIITGFLLGVAAISLLVGSVGIANTMFTSVLERTREIGTMKALGAKNSDILSLFLIESGILGLLGGILGVLLGFLIGKLITYIAVNQLGASILQVLTPTWLVIGCLLFSFLIGAISGVWPAYRASKLKTVEALRYE